MAEGLADTRSQAQGLILAGRILVDDVPVDKCGARVASDAVLRIKGGIRRFVSRGGEKLAGALEDLAVDPRGLSCLDIGASTGGFTDCLLQGGARRVIAVDVGYGQLAQSLRDDPRVVILEKTNARYLEADRLPWPVDLVVVDVSFISIRLLLPRLVAIAPGVPMLLMVKPQFEVAREKVGKGGVVRVDEDRREVVDRIGAAARELGFREEGRAPSRLLGPKGNQEIFLHIVPG